MCDAVTSSVVGAAIWHVILVCYGKYNDHKLRMSLSVASKIKVIPSGNTESEYETHLKKDTVQVALDAYAGIHRSPYLYIRNVSTRPIEVVAVVLNIVGIGDYTCPYETENKEGEGSLVLSPEAWAKWVFCAGRTIPEHNDNLVSCTIVIKYKLWGINRLLKIAVDGELLSTLRAQLKENKRNFAKG